MTKFVKNVVKAVRGPKGVECYKAEIFKGMKQLRLEARISKTDVAIAKKLVSGTFEMNVFGTSKRCRIHSSTTMSNADWID